MKVIIGCAVIAALLIIGVAMANMDGDSDEGLQDWQVENTQEARAEREHTRDKELACIENGGTWRSNTETCRQPLQPSSSSRDRDPLPTVDIGSSDMLEEESKETTCMVNGGRWRNGICFGAD